MPDGEAPWPEPPDTAPPAREPPGDNGRLLDRAVVAALETRGGRHHGDELRAHCPFTEHSRADPGFSVNTTTGAWTCHACGRSGGPRELAEALGVPTANGRADSVCERRWQIGRYTHVRIDFADGSKRMWWEPKGAKVATLPLYGADLVAQAEPHAPVIVCEGEKAADALRRIAEGTVVVATVTGASGCPSRASLEVLGKRLVYVWPDADEAGEKHVAKLVSMLGMMGEPTPRIIRMDARRKGDDAADFVARGGTAQDLATLMEAAETWAPAEERVAVTAEPESRDSWRTEQGAARRLAADHVGRILYCAPLKTWYLYAPTEGRWARDERCAIVRLGMDWARRETVAAAQLPAGDTRDEALKHALRCEGEATLRHVLTLAQSLLPVVPAEFDADLSALVCANGVLDLDARKLSPHSPDTRATRTTDVPYHQDATAPTWRAWLETMLPDPDVRAFVQRAAGLSACGRVSDRTFFCCVGPSGTGKSTFCGAIRSALGSYVGSVSADALTVSDMDDLRAGVEFDSGRFLLSSEVRKGARWRTALLKQFTGGQDLVGARPLHCETYHFRPRGHVWLFTNHKPKADAADSALWQRLRPVGFNVEIPEDDQDETFGDQLQAEAPGILRWLVEGYALAAQFGLGYPAAVRRASAEYRTSEDVVGAFLGECTRPTGGAIVKKADLYARYRTWSEANGEKPLTQIGLTKAMNERGHGEKTCENQRCWAGLRLFVEGSLDV